MSDRVAVPGDRASAGARLTFVGHATLLLELDGVRLLTDPLLRRHAGALLRRVPLPDRDVRRGVDAVLLSHLHLDHVDVGSLRLLEGRPQLIVPEHGVSLLHRRGFRNVTGVRRGDTVTVGRLRVTATAAAHAGRRRPGTAAGDALGYLIEGSIRAYFTGDTGLFDGMKELAGGLDVVCLPIGGWGPRIPVGHLDPTTAAQALAMLRPRHAVAIHWGTYRPPGVPASWFQPAGGAQRAFATAAARLAPGVTVQALLPGEGVVIRPRSAS